MGIDAVDAGNHRNGDTFFSFTDQCGVFIYIVFFDLVIIVIKLVQVVALGLGLFQNIIIFKGDFLLEYRL